MTLDEFFQIGQPIALGSHRFDAGEITRFARLYDPQPFHIDAELARNSVFGALCASGWHTAAIWMRLNLRELTERKPEGWTGAGPEPEWGPSPGFQNMRWPKPVFAGEMVSFSRTAIAHRRLASRPGWRALTLQGGATDSKGDTVLDFESAVLVKAA